MADTQDVRVEVNGRPHRTRAATPAMLADFLRDTLHLKGCRIGCDQSVCGACTVLVDGMPRAACSTFLWAVSGSKVLTIEGLEQEGRLHPLQAAFLEADAFQCGFCTAGMILTAKALLDCNPVPDDREIRDWLSGNICRCTGYQMIIEAVKAAAAVLRGAPA
jgi:carbon-monoxide dehydrogenase small subunit